MLGWKVTKRTAQNLKQLSKTVELSQTEVIKSVIYKIQEDVLDVPKPTSMQELLRPLLAALWLERGLGQPPMRFEELVDAIVDKPALRKAIDKLLAIKKKAKEADTAQPIPAILHRHGTCQTFRCNPADQETGFCHARSALDGNRAHPSSGSLSPSAKTRKPDGGYVGWPAACRRSG